ncbi:hypothetical protein TGP89_419730 [Toxoplasma gondii p89]|uniref:Uncharacterized protein n=1 Tax=Toxoplasma gondii p89 TaxID=943119 RepID=A0A086K5L8_TOXGO|nr:hypothetical protein TGP89_419730 [Toxoplasma gondii p89]
MFSSIFAHANLAVATSKPHWVCVPLRVFFTRAASFPPGVKHWRLSRPPSMFLLSVPETEPLVSSARTRLCVAMLARLLSLHTCQGKDGFCVDFHVSRPSFWGVQTATASFWRSSFNL